MKARIILNGFAGVYTNAFLAEFANDVINGELVKDWVTTSILPSQDLKIPIWNGTTWIESQTAQQIQDNILTAETQRYEQRTIDGQKAYAKISAEFRLAKLAGLITEQAHGVIEKLLINVRNEILAGQWKSGLMELETLGNAIIGVDLYNRLHLQITTYVTANY